MNPRLCLIGIALAFVPMQAFAVTALEQSERLLILESLLLDFKYNGGMLAKSPALGVDFINQPNIDYTVGSKKEKIRKPPFVPRPRVRLWYGNLFVGAGYIPPVEINDLSASVGSIEYGYRFKWRHPPYFSNFLNDVFFILRTTATQGEITGHITTTTNDDRVTVRLQSVDGLATYAGISEFLVYGGFGVGELSSDIFIDADKARIEVRDYAYRYLFYGLTFLDGDYSYTLQQDFHLLLRNFTINVQKRF